jgi:hypothetical protein
MNTMINMGISFIRIDMIYLLWIDLFFGDA